MIIFESLYFAKSILNIVACEGLDRMVRPESCNSWRRRLHGLAFVPHTVMEEAREVVERVVTRFAQGFELEHSRGVVRLTWHERPMLFASTWGTHEMS